MKKAGIGRGMLAAVVFGAALLGMALTSAGSAKGVDVDLWPLLEVTKDGTTVCYPF